MRSLQDVARKLVLVCVHQAQPLDERRRCGGREGSELLLELERTLEHAGRHTLRTKLREAELREEECEQHGIAAVLHDLSRVPCQPYRRRRSVAKKRREDSRHDDLGPQSRIEFGLDERLLEQPLRLLEIVTRALANPPQHVGTFGTRWQVLDEWLEDQTRPLRVAARILVVGG